MKKKRDSVVAMLVVLFICLLLGLTRFLPSREVKEGYSAYDHLQLGMSRDEARPYMHSAWRRYECEYGESSVREVYLFGPHGQVPASYAIEMMFDDQDDIGRLTRFGVVSDSMFPVHVSDDCDIYDAPWETPSPSVTSTFAPPETATLTPVPDPTLTATLAPLVIPTFTPVPTLSGEAGVNPGSLIVDELAFLSRQGEDAWLYTVAVDGSGLARVSEAVYQWDQPQWSPDGKALAFLSRASEDISSLYVIRESDPSPVRVTTGLDVTSYAWSPESDRIALSAVVEGEEDIYLLSLDTLAPVNVTSSQGIVEHRPIWSPTGTQIAFYFSSAVSNSFDCPEGCGWQIYVMDIDGTTGCCQIRANPENLTDTECVPVWSPTGRYLSFRQGCIVVEPWLLYLVDWQTGQRLQLTDAQWMIRDAEWLSEDEIFVVNMNDQFAQLCVLNRFGKGAQILFSGANPDYSSTSWTADHRFYVWSGRGSHEIFIGELATSRFVSTGLKGCDPEWSPSGDWLAFTTECLEEAQESDVWVVRWDGSGLLNLTEAVPGDSSNVAWRP